MRLVPIYIALVRAGESSGTLDTVLARLADTLESQAEFRSKVKGAMVYPVIIMIGMFAVVMVMMTVVVSSLRISIKILVSSFRLHENTYFSLDIFCAFLVAHDCRHGGALYRIRQMEETPIGELMVDSITLKLPLFGDLTKKYFWLSLPDLGHAYQCRYPYPAGAPDAAGLIGQCPVPQCYR